MPQPLETSAPVAAAPAEPTGRPVLEVIAKPPYAPFAGTGRVDAVAAVADGVAVFRGTTLSWYDPQGELRWTSPWPVPADASGLGPRVSSKLDVDETRVAVANGTHGFAVYARDDGRLLGKGGPPLGVVWDVALVPGGVVTAHGSASLMNGHMTIPLDGPCAVCRWSDAGERTHTISPSDFRDSATAVEVDADGAVYVATGTGRIRWFDAGFVEQGSERLASDRIAALRRQRDGGWLAVSEVGDVVAWKPGSKKRIGALDASVFATAVGEGVAAITSFYDAPVQIHVDGTRKRLPIPRETSAVAFAPDGTLYAAEPSGAVRAWRDGVALGEPLRTVVAIASNATEIVVFDGTVTRKVAAGAVGGPPLGRVPEGAQYAAITSDGRLITAGVFGGDEAFTAWVSGVDGAARKRLPFELNGSSFTGAIAGNTRAAVLSYERVLFVDAAGTREWRAPDQVAGAGFSSDDRFVVSTEAGRLLAWGDGVEPLWNIEIPRAMRKVARGVGVVAVASESEVRTFAEDSGAAGWQAALAGVTAIAVAPAGERVVVGLADGALVVLDAANGKELGRANEHQGAVTAIASRGTSPDGAWNLSTAGADARVVAWTVR